MNALRLLICCLFLSSLYASTAWAQMQPPGQEDTNYTKEWGVGVLFTSNGGTIGGISVRHARKYTIQYKVEETLGVNSGKEKTSTLKEGYLERKGMYHSFSLDMLNIKHAKEQSYQAIEGGSYVKGKKNYFWILRPAYGREFILFRKARERGVQVNFLATAGPSIGLLAPYMVQVFDSEKRIAVIEQHDRLKHSPGGSRPVLGTASLLESISRMSARLGLGLKASLACDFGITNRSVSGVEAGLMIDAFPDRIPIMDGPPNDRFFPTVFMNFYFGSRK